MGTAPDSSELVLLLVLRILQPSPIQMPCWQHTDTGKTRVKWQAWPGKTILPSPFPASIETPAQPVIHGAEIILMLMYLHFNVDTSLVWCPRSHNTGSQRSTLRSRGGSAGSISSQFWGTGHSLASHWEWVVQQQAQTPIIKSCSKDKCTTWHKSATSFLSPMWVKVA